MAKVQNEKAVNFQDSIGRIYALGEDKSDNIVRLYTAIISAPESGQTYPTGSIISPMRELINNNNTLGEYSSSVTTNQAINPVEQDVTFRNDYVYNQDTGIVEVNKNVLVNMVSGTSFSDGANTVKVVGTNGTRLVNPPESQLDFKYLFWEDGKLLRPQSDDGTGNLDTQTNTLVSAYDNESICCAQEILTSRGAEDSGYRYPYVISSNVNMTDSEEPSTFTSSCMFLNGGRSLDEFIIDGFGTYAQAVDSGDTLKKVDVTYVEEGATLATPTATSEVGDTAAIVDTDDGTVLLFTDDGAGAWTEEAAADMSEGCVIHGKDEATSEAKLIAIKTSGVSASAVAVDWDLSVGANQYLLDIKDWSFTAEDWAVYTI